MQYWNPFQEKAMSTAIYPPDRAAEYTALGLASEIGEVVAVLYTDEDFEYKTQRMKAETGDCFWYCAALASAIGMPLQEVALLSPVVTYSHSVPRVLGSISIAAADICGIVKKTLRDDTGELSPEKQGRIAKELGRILWLLDNLCTLLGTNRHAVMHANLSKLSDRQERGVLTGSGDAR